jgi:hypothetical protein
MSCSVSSQRRRAALASYRELGAKARRPIIQLTDALIEREELRQQISPHDTRR